MTGDQQWPGYEPSSSRSESADPPGSPPHGETLKLDTPSPRAPRPRRGRQRSNGAAVLMFGVAPAVVLLGVGGIIAVSAGNDGVPGLGKPDALSADGLDQLRADIREETGGTEVFRAVIYPEYASVDLPVDDRSQRSETLFWDGDLNGNDSKSTSSYGRIDLADVDAAIVLEAVATAKTLVEDPESWYVIIDGPSASFPDEIEQDPPTITAYASNEYSESGYVELTFDGTEIRRVEPEVP